MWLQRLLERIDSHPGPILIEGGETFGSPFLIDALRRNQHVAWIQLTPADAADFVATGNRLAEAINSTMDVNFLPQALPFNFGLTLLKKRLPLVKPLTIVCSNADYVPLFRDSLLELPPAKAKIILVTNGPTSAFRYGLHLRQEELALTPDEAKALAGHFFSHDDIHTLWRSCGGEYLTFLSSVHRLRGRPLPEIPSPAGEFLPEEAELLVSPSAMLEVLISLKRYVEALEVAVMSVPERVADIISEAGTAYQERGLLKRLHLLLESLDEKYGQDERVLAWRLVAGFDQANYVHLMPLIDTFLKNGEAPELRARYAGMLTDPDERFNQAQRAEAAETNALTLWQLGRTHPDGKKGVDILHRAHKLAEAGGRPSEIARNAGTLAESLVYVGRFREAVIWSQWALQTNQRMGAKNGVQRLYNVCTDMNVHTILGRTEGLKETLVELLDAAQAAELNHTMQIRLSLSNLELALGNIPEAERLAAENLDKAPRHRRGDVVLPLVRALLEQEKFEEAMTVTKEVSVLVANEHVFSTLPASLALGMVYSFTQPELARDPLLSVLRADDIEATFRIMAALHLLRVEAITLSNLDPEVLEMLRDLSPTGFRLFSGPKAAFAETWALFSTDQVPLQVRVLGQAEVWLDRKRVPLGERALEILVLLALHPDGLTSATLHHYLYRGENVKDGSLRVALSRLRKLVPLNTSSEINRITVPYTFDVADVKEAVAAGQVNTATKLYRGPLLEKSDAPGIVEARLLLERSLRQSALASNNVEVIVPLAETLKDDIELWQAARDMLPSHDPRLPFVRAELHRSIQSLQPTYN